MKSKEIILAFLVLNLFPEIACSHDDATDFPPILDADDIQYFSEHHDIDGLHWALSNVFQRSQRNPNTDKIVYDELPSILVSRGGGSTYTSAYKLKMDLEQAEYLVQCQTTSIGTKRMLSETVIPTYRQVLSNIPPLEHLERTAGLYAFKKEDYEAGIGEVYNKALHHTDFGVLKGINGELVPLLSDSFDSNMNDA